LCVLAQRCAAHISTWAAPQYATAECDNLTQLVTHDRASERVARTPVIDAEQRRPEGDGGDLSVLKTHRLGGIVQLPKTT
jgi:proteasome accessory factor A